MHLISTSVLLGATFALAVLVVGTPARAQDKTQCINAHVEGQKLRRGGQLQRARADFVTCSRPECPDPIVKECSEWLGEVDASMPSVLVEVADGAGERVTKAKLYVDGELASAELRGLPIDLDPGEHVLFAEVAGRRTAETRVLLSVGERQHRVLLSFPKTGPKKTVSPATEPGEAKTTKLPVTVWILGGFGLAAAGTGAYLAIRAKNQSDDLETRCAPRCERDEAESMRTKALVADVAFGVAALSFGAATYLALSSSNGSPRTSAAIVPVHGGVATRYSIRF